MNCKNCHSELVGDYCHNCGQKAIERFSAKSVANWITEDVFVFDKGFAFTAKQVLMQPSLIAQDYLTGITKKYFNPYKFILIVTTVPFLVLSFLPDYQSTPSNLELLKDWPGAFTTSSIIYFADQFIYFVSANFFIYVLITIPFWSLLSWALFRKRKLNYVEHLIFISYLSSGYLILFICFCLFIVSLVYLLKSKDNDALIISTIFPALIILAIYLAKSARKFFNESYLKVLFKGILVTYLGIILSMILQFIILSIWKLLLLNF